MKARDVVKVLEGYDCLDHEAGRHQGVVAMKAYPIIIEGEDETYSAYSPDLPGCVAAGGSAEEVAQLMREAVPLHIESLRTHGEPVPPPSRIEFVEAV